MRQVAAHPLSRFGFFLAAYVPRGLLTPATMASSSQQQKGRDAVLPTLDVFIQVLSIAKDTCGIPPAQIAFGSANVLLTMIRVRFSSLSGENDSPTHVCLGHDGQRSRLYRPWAGLRRCMPSTLPKIEGETVGRSQPVHP